MASRARRRGGFELVFRRLVVGRADLDAVLGRADVADLEVDAVGDLAVALGRFEGCFHIVDAVGGRGLQIDVAGHVDVRDRDIVASGRDDRVEGVVVNVDLFERLLAADRGRLEGVV